MPRDNVIHIHTQVPELILRPITWESIIAQMFRAKITDTGTVEVFKWGRLIATCGTMDRACQVIHQEEARERAADRRFKRTIHALRQTRMIRAAFPRVSAPPAAIGHLIGG